MYTPQNLWYTPCYLDSAWFGDLSIIFIIVLGLHSPVKGLMCPRVACCGACLFPAPAGAAFTCAACPTAGEMTPDCTWPGVGESVCRVIFAPSLIWSMVSSASAYLVSRLS